MTAQTHPTVPTAIPTREDPGVPKTWTRARLIEPSTAGFLHVGASTGSWRLPVALPSARRRAVLALMRAAATALHRDPRVVRADVFEGLLRAPGRNSSSAALNAPVADFDAVLLIETRTVTDATDLRVDTVVAEPLTELHATAARTLVFAASNVRRIGPVEHDRRGVFLFNYFSAPDVETNLFAWQHTAGWFQEQTGLDNSTVLQPVEPQTIPYSVVNHCRWDHLGEVLRPLLLKRSFRSFVLRVFADNGVAPRPILYKLHDVS